MPTKTEVAVASAIALVTIVVIIVLALALQKYQLDTSVPLVRAAVRATWPMGIEGFANMSIQDWLPSPEALTKNSTCDTDAPAPYKPYAKGVFESYTLLRDWLVPLDKPTQEQKEDMRASCMSAPVINQLTKSGGLIAAGPTSQQCYQKDYARTLERAGSYAQRTNNYRHADGESCSAPNHDLILDFYKPNNAPAPYQV